MKRYLTNLALAIVGVNPYRKELDELSEHYEKMANEVGLMRDLYERGTSDLKKAEKNILSYQTLVENLRSRLDEKDVMLKSMKDEYELKLNKLKESKEHEESK